MSNSPDGTTGTAGGGPAASTLYFLADGTLAIEADPTIGADRTDQAKGALTATRTPTIDDLPEVDESTNRPVPKWAREKAVAQKLKWKSSLAVYKDATSAVVRLEGTIDFHKIDYDSTAQTITIVPNKVTVTLIWLCGALPSVPRTGRLDALPQRRTDGG